MLFTLREVIEALILTGVVGWIFMDVFAPNRSPDDFLRHARNKSWWRDAWLVSALLVATSIILHELGHKFVALAFGLTAVFHAAWLWVGIGVIMKLVSGIIFFVPAYVSIYGTAPAWAFASVALAGPAVNFVLWGVARVAPDIRKNMTGRQVKHKELQ